METFQPGYFALFRTNCGLTLDRTAILKWFRQKKRMSAWFFDTIRSTRTKVLSFFVENYFYVEGHIVKNIFNHILLWSTILCFWDLEICQLVSICFLFGPNLEISTWLEMPLRRKCKLEEHPEAEFQVRSNTKKAWKSERRKTSRTGTLKRFLDMNVILGKV